MAKPVYTIELIKRDIVTSESFVNQLVVNTSQIFGRVSTTEALGQTFKPVSSSNLTLLTLKLNKFAGASSDNIRTRLFQSDRTTLIADSPTILPINTLTVTLQDFDFVFNDISLQSGVTYFFEVYRTGAGTVDNPNAGVSVTNPYADGLLYTRIGSTWTPVSARDLYFKLKFETPSILKGTPMDITTDVLSVKTNRGRNEADGNLKQGTSDIILNNKDKRYSLDNEDSDLFDTFRLFSIIEIKAEYDSTEYPIFSGLIKTIRPNLLFNLQTVDVSIVDIFYSFKNEKISTSLLSGKTADEIIEIVLNLLLLTSGDYSLDTDTEVLEDITFTDENALSALALAVEVGQHHHFIDGDGKYIFKNNTWLDDNTPKYTFNYLDEIVNDGKIFFEHDGIRNFIKVIWGSNTAQAVDIVSKSKYGLKEFTLDNELMPASDDIYASFIAEFIEALFNEPGNQLELFLSDKFPEVLDINLGDAIRFKHTDHGIDFIYSVLGVSHDFTNLQSHATSLICRKWVAPPFANVIDFEPFIGNAFLIPSNDSIAVSQGVKRTADFKIIHATFILKSNLSDTEDITIKIFAVDGAGLPTGSPLAISNINIIVSGSQNNTYKFTFNTFQRPTLLANVQYTMVINTLKSDGDYLPGIIRSAPLSSITTKTKVAMSFKVPQKGKLRIVSSAFDVSVPPFKPRQFITPKLYTDSGGFPGALISTGVVFGFTPGVSQTDFLMEALFTASPILDKNTIYWLVWERTADLTWSIWGETGNPYIDGVAASFNGGWSLMPAGEDVWFKIFMLDFISNWEIWGKTGNPYVDGIPGEEIDGSAWSSLAPNDFYFKLGITE